MVSHLIRIQQHSPSLFYKVFSFEDIPFDRAKFLSNLNTSFFYLVYKLLCVCVCMCACMCENVFTNAFNVIYIQTGFHTLVIVSPFLLSSLLHFYFVVVVVVVVFAFAAVDWIPYMNLFFRSIHFLVHSVCLVRCKCFSDSPSGSF